MLPVGRFVSLKSPASSASAALLIGLLLTAWSVVIGAHHYSVGLDIQGNWSQSVAQAPVVLKGVRLSAGFLDACNYGLWYLFFCPLVYAFASYFLKSATLPTEGLTVKLPSPAAEFGTPHARIAAIALGCFFFWSVVAIEIRDFNGNVCFGWVQTWHAMEWQRRLGSGEKVTPACTLSAIWIDPKTLTPTGDKPDMFEVRKFEIKSIEPVPIKAGPFWAYLLFIFLVKTWVALWQWLVVWFSYVALTWGVGLCRSLSLVKEEDITESGWLCIGRPMVTLLWLGALGNLFTVLRVYSNASKGSFGSWDQFSGLIGSLGPGLVALGVGFAVFAKLYFERGFWPKGLLSTFAVATAGIWAGTTPVVLKRVLDTQQSWVAETFRGFLVTVAGIMHTAAH